MDADDETGSDFGTVFWLFDDREIYGYVDIVDRSVVLHGGARSCFGRCCGSRGLDRNRWACVGGQRRRR